MLDHKAEKENDIPQLAESFSSQFYDTDRLEEKLSDFGMRPRTDLGMSLMRLSCRIVSFPMTACSFALVRACTLAVYTPM